MFKPRRSAESSLAAGTATTSAPVVEAGHSARRHSVGDVLENNYAVTEVCGVDRGVVHYRCERISDGAKVAVESLSLRRVASPNRPDVGEDIKKKLLKDEAKSDHPCVDSFETGQGDDKRLYVVKMIPPTAPAALEITQPEIQIAIEPESRPCPDGAPCVVQKRGGTQLDVQIPARGLFSGVGVTAMLFFLLLIVVTVAITVLGIATIAVEDDALGLLALIIAIPLWVISVKAFLAFPVWLCGRKELIITPADFSIRTTLQPKSNSPQVVHRRGARASSISIINSLFMTEVSGATAGLIKAEVKEPSSNDYNPAKILVLVEGRTEHELKFNLTTEQKQWLVGEINEVLGVIRTRPR